MYFLQKKHFFLFQQTYYFIQNVLFTFFLSYPLHFLLLILIFLYFTFETYISKFTYL